MIMRRKVEGDVLPVSLQDKTGIEAEEEMIEETEETAGSEETEEK